MSSEIPLPMPRFVINSPIHMRRTVPAVSVTMIWKAYPFVSTMALAGLQSIPDDLYGAARVDGATARQQFLHVTLPSLMPVIAITAVLLVLWLCRDFSIVYVMTQGGPVRATQTLSIMTYQQAFSFFRMGYASAVGVVTRGRSRR